MRTALVQILLLTSTVLSFCSLKARIIRRAKTTHPLIEQPLPSLLKRRFNAHLHQLWHDCFKTEFAQREISFSSEKTVLRQPCIIDEKASIGQQRAHLKSHYTSPQTIPRVIHQICLEPSLSEYQKKQQKLWIENHPTWHYILWKNTSKTYNPTLAARCSKYQERHIDELDSRSLEPMISSLYRTEDKQDILKYLILADNGGVYAHWHIESLKPLDSLHVQHRCYLATYQAAPGFYRAGILAATPSHPLVMHALDAIQQQQNSTSSVYPAKSILLTHAYHACSPEELDHAAIIDDEKQTLWKIYAQERFTDTKIWWQAYQHIIPKQNRKFTIVIPSYNNDDWFHQNLQSIIKQKYPYYNVIYLNDASTDNTASNVASFITKNNVLNRFTIENNTVNKGGLANLYDAVHQCCDDDIVIELDGDDWFAHDHVLDLLNKVYASGNTWMTYGQYTQWPNPEGSIQPGIPLALIQKGHVRGNWGWMAPLRSFYAWLFKRIKKDDLCIESRFMRVSWDHAFMWPMAEMARDHVSFIEDLLYIYNRANELSDSSRHTEQKKIMNYLCTKTPYEKITNRR